LNSRSSVSASNSKAPVQSMKSGTGAVKAQPMNKIHKGDLGYIPQKGLNVHQLVRSKLNHDTVSYRGKFERPSSEQKDAMKKVHTLGDTVKNGFISSASAGRTGGKHNTPAPRPAKYMLAHQGKKSKSGGLLQMLQSTANQSTVASLKGAPTIMPSVKAMDDGTYTRFAL